MIYRNADLSLRKASGENNFIGQSPRYLIEALGMTLISMLAYTLTLQDGGVLAAIPTLVALAVGAQKVLPALQQAYRSFSQIKGARSSFSDVMDLLDQPLPHTAGQGSVDRSADEIVFKGTCVSDTQRTPLGFEKY